MALPELNKEAIRNATNIANPGCFATAIQLGLLPLAQAGLLERVHTTGITGSTGAGQSLNATSHFSWRANNIGAYKTLTHHHVKESARASRSFNRIRSSRRERQKTSDLDFIPWRGDFTRGIFISSQSRLRSERNRTPDPVCRLLPGCPIHCHEQRAHLPQAGCQHQQMCGPAAEGRSKLVVHSSSTTS